MSFQVGVKHYDKTQVQDSSNLPSELSTNSAGSNATSSTTNRPRVFPKGSPSERLWIIAESALDKDQDKGYLFSSALGWNFQKILDANSMGGIFITSADCYLDEQELIIEANRNKPPILLLLDNSYKRFLPNIQIEKGKTIASWAGSLLISPLLNYPHYVIPTFGPKTCVSDWIERQIVQSVDIAKAKSELDYWSKNNQTLQPLPERQLVTDLKGWDLIQKFENWHNNDSLEYLSIDIESIYPRDKSEFYGHPGYPVICGIAINPTWGYSFNLWDEDKAMAVRIWSQLARLLSKKKIIGQNFTNFDAKHFDMLGMPIELTSEVIAAGGQSRIYDTMFRHAVLWPELSHSLQFMTRQYTRQPYYKDEGKGWNPKEMIKWMKYNAQDCCTTFEVFLAQEEEFSERPHLR